LKPEDSGKVWRPFTHECCEKSTPLGRSERVRELPIADFRLPIWSLDWTFDPPPQPWPIETQGHHPRPKTKDQSAIGNWQSAMNGFRCTSEIGLWKGAAKVNLCSVDFAAFLRYLKSIRHNLWKRTVRFAGLLTFRRLSPDFQSIS